MEEERFSHEDYNTGVANGSIRLGIINQPEFWRSSFKPYLILIDQVLTIINILLLISIPVLSYIFHDWTLLFGFLGCFIGWVLHLICIGAAKSDTRIKRTKIIFLILIIGSAILIYNFGIVSLASFVLAFTICEFAIFYFSGNLLMEMAIRNLGKNKDAYYSAVNNGIIKTFRT